MRNENVQCTSIFLKKFLWQFKDVAAIVAGTEEMHEDAKKQIIPIGKLLSQVFHDLKVGIVTVYQQPLPSFKLLI